MSEQAAPKDFFISYNKADKAWAEWIAWQLEQNGYTVIIQAWDFRPGHNFVVEMHNAATKAIRTLAVLSPDFFGASFTQAEWAAAFKQDPTGEKGLLLPVRVRECNPEGLLGTIAYIDLVGKKEEEAAKEVLLLGVKQKRAKPSQAPKFPGVEAAPAPRYPGALPSIWNLPHGHNPNFTGREDLLKALREALASGEAAAITQPQAIHGLGGVGKTALAVEYAYLYAPEHDLIWWVRSEEPATLASDYAGLAQNLADIPQEVKASPDQGVVVASVRTWLQQHPGWLLIFDNVETPDALKEYLPHGGPGHVIITSRNPVWGKVARPLPVQVLPREKSVEFLIKRTGQDDEAAAAVLAGELGDLPLALEQAGAYMEETGTPLADYLLLFQKRRRDLWADQKRPDDYHATVETTWSLSLNQIEKESPTARDLLNLCAFFAPDDIPISLLQVGEKLLPEPLARSVADDLVFNKTIGALKRYSLMERGEDSLVVHRLVQAVVQDRLEIDEQKNWARAALEVVNADFPRNVAANPVSWPVCGRLLPLALTAAGHAEKLQVGLQAAASLLNQAGLYLEDRAELWKAKALFERALHIAEAFYGPDHLNVATAVNNLGGVLRALGDLEGAKECYERALHIDEASYGPDHSNVAIVFSNLGGVLKDQGDLAGAKECYERALKIEGADSPDQLAVARYINNLGEILRVQGDLAGAKECYERSLAILEKALAPENIMLASGVNNLGLVLHAQGDLAGAKECHERALQIDEAVYGPDHPAVARDINNLGGVLKDQGDLAGAKECYERALKILTKFLGPNNRRTQTVRRNLASLESMLRG